MENIKVQNLNLKYFELKICLKHPFFKNYSGVACKLKFSYGFKVFITGSCQKLGSWSPHRLMPLVPEATYDGQQSDEETIWTTSLHLPTEEVRN